MNVMMIIGSYPFMLGNAAYQRLQRSSRQNIAKLQHLGGSISRQHIGKGDDRIRLQGLIYEEITEDPRAHIKSLNAIADTGEPQFLIGGDGHVFGRYMIESIQETETVFWADGAPRKISFSISLGISGDD